MRSHIINGHYMFGNTFIQPEMPMYERIVHHNVAPVRRPIPPYPDMNTRPIHCPAGKPGCCLGYEDSTTKVDTPYDDSSYSENCDCTDCPFSGIGINRNSLLFNVLDIETSIVKTLKVTIYGTSVDKDKTIEMKTGSRYAVTYITEHGLITTVGRLELISESVPDACTRYINTTNMAAASTAYIGMDCSTEGNSDKRKIYIATIRYIQEIVDDTEVEDYTTVTLKQRFEKVIAQIEEGQLTERTKNLLDDIDKYDLTFRLEKLLTKTENDELRDRVEALLDQLDNSDLRDRIKNILDSIDEKDLLNRADEVLKEVSGIKVTVLETIED